MKKIETFLAAGLEQARKDAAKATSGEVRFAMTIEDHIVLERKAYADAMKGVTGVFTRDQKRIWDDLVGEPFPFGEK